MRGGEAEGRRAVKLEDERRQGRGAAGREAGGCEAVRPKGGGSSSWMVRQQVHAVSPETDRLLQMLDSP
jgi:hypothetical protein